MLLQMMHICIEDEEAEQAIKEKRKRIWVRQLHDRGDLNISYTSLRDDLLISGPEFYRSFTRMSESDFEFILEIIRPFIQKEDTRLRRAIPADERLAITLRFLSTGQTYFSLATTFRCAVGTVCGIIMEVCQSINTLMFKEWIKVSLLAFYLYL